MLRDADAFPASVQADVPGAAAAVSDPLQTGEGGDDSAARVRGRRGDGGAFGIRRSRLFRTLVQAPVPDESVELPARISSLKEQEP